MKKVFFLLPLVILINSCYQISPKYCTLATVTNTEVVRGSESSHYRASFVDEAGQPFMLTNKDDISTLKFNSGNVQAVLDAASRDGSEVWVSYYGWRNPILSMFPNIKSVSKDVPCL